MANVHRLIATLTKPITLRRWAFAGIVANVVIVITGGAVRLTGSGLGCPTWPRCTEDSYTANAEMGIYAAIEFGNRLLTFGVGFVAAIGLASALLQRDRRRRVIMLSALVMFGIPAQAIVGGITVLTELNPWVVGWHFLVSMAVIACAYAFWRAAGESAASTGVTSGGPAIDGADGTAVDGVGGAAIDGVGGATIGSTAVASRWLRALATVLAAVSAIVLVLGTFVTGSGPHAGDTNAKRNGLDPEMISQLHADGVFLLLGLAVATWFAMRAIGAAHVARRTAWLLAIIAAQGAIGLIQYATNLPVVLVGAHIAGACAVWLATIDVFHATRTRLPHTRLLHARLPHTPLPHTPLAHTTGAVETTPASVADHELGEMISGRS